MKRRRLVGPGLMLVANGLMLLAAAGCGKSPGLTEASTVGTQSHGANASGISPADVSGSGMTAIEQAAAAGKYLFIMVVKAEDDQSIAMRKVFDAATQKMTDRADRIVVDITDAAEKPIVEKFQLERAPMPLVLAIAPNGAITGGFPTKVEEHQLLEAFVSPATQQCLKSLQGGKLVFLCIQNAKTKSNAAAIRGVNDFKADERFGHATTVIALDPTDKKEAAFLADLQVAPETTEAITVFLAPPGRPVAKYEGATEKQMLVDALSKANSACCPGGSCGPNGCNTK